MQFHSHRVRFHRLASSIAVVLVALVPAAFGEISPSPALAGEFTISSCQANGEFSSGAFENFATRGMKWRRACNPLGPGLRGLVTANVPREGHVAVGSQSAFVLEAPPETTFSNLKWSGEAHRRDCRYALQLYAVRPDGSADQIRNVMADQKCPKAAKAAQGASWPRPTLYELGGATKLVQRVVCMGAPQAEYCSGKGQNYLQTFTSEATVVDDSAPSVSVAGGGGFLGGEWTAGTQGVGYEASDNTGIKSVQGSVSGVATEAAENTCDYTQRIPCPGGSGSINVDTTKLGEGTRQLQLKATDAAGNQAESSPVTVRIDNTPPGAVPVALEGGEAWRNHDAFAVGWVNPDEGDRAPIVAAHWRICRVGTQECQTGTANGPSVAAIGGLAVPGPGEWEVQMWRQDAAGNTQPQNASVAARLRFDPEPPEVGFEPIAAQDPTRIAVHLADKLSGIQGGEMEMSRVGSGVWQPLDSSLEGDELVTRIDDASLPAGEYQLRATATDYAGNQASSESRIDGQPMKINLPLRVPTTVDAVVLAHHVVTKVVHRHGKRRVKKHEVSETGLQATVEFGSKAQFSGHLLDKSGSPMAGASIAVWQAIPEEQGETQVATLTTGSDGGFAYEVTPESSRHLRFVYSGTATSLPAEGSAEVLVHSASTVKVTPKHVLNGGSVTFSGEVEGRPLPAAGKLVELQVRLTHEWSTFRTIRTDPEGHWSIEYPFKRTCGKEEYKFRARLPGEGGFPLGPGQSHVIGVSVRGRPCPTA
jgi:5-hydroxyisourate hydrolase-like protein (transthyretin family)